MEIDISYLLAARDAIMNPYYRMAAYGKLRRWASVSAQAKPHLGYFFRTKIVNPA